MWVTKALMLFAMLDVLMGNTNDDELASDFPHDDARQRDGRG
jgi:hypothetical protein